MDNLKDQSEGSWHEIKGKAMQYWSKLTHDDFKDVKGGIEEMKGKIQKLYGYSKDQVETEFGNFIKKASGGIKSGIEKLNEKLDHTKSEVKEENKEVSETESSPEIKH